MFFNWFRLSNKAKCTCIYVFGGELGLIRLTRLETNCKKNKKKTTHTSVHLYYAICKKVDIRIHNRYFFTFLKQWNFIWVAQHFDNVCDTYLAVGSHKLCEPNRVPNCTSKIAIVHPKCLWQKFWPGVYIITGVDISRRLHPGFS